MAMMFVVGTSFVLTTEAKEPSSTDALLLDAVQYLKTAPEKSTLALTQLQRMESTFSEKQRDKYYLLLASSLAFRGKYKEQVALVQSVINQVKTPETHASYLYYLSDGYTNLGDYENALLAMNEGIVLLPKLVELDAKVHTLQAAIVLLSSLHAYDEALNYAVRMYALEKNNNGVAKCTATADLVEINFLRGDSKRARTFLPEAVQTCDANGSKIISLMVKALAAIDLIDGGNEEQGRSVGLLLLAEFSKINETSDYVTQLEEAIARAYLKQGNLLKAERYGLQAHQHAKSGNVMQLIEKASETMAAIKRAQGQLGSALDYYDTSLALKRKVLDDQLHKNLAYQRVKFDTQDKANQLSLLEQKNKVLAVEQQLAKRNNQNLLLVITLVALLSLSLAFWLLKTLRQKNLFRLSAQIDGLTQISNRSHFMAGAGQEFRKYGKPMSVVLFDMDAFKQINDTFGHAVGDWVLKAVSETVKAHLRKADLFGRLGGEEFAICLPESGEQEALQLAERCRAAIAAIDTDPSGYRFPLSASFGVATKGSHGLAHLEETLAAADKALYFSKTEGRNRVSVYQ